MRIGTRTAVYVGLCSTTVLTILFGLGPDMVPGWQPVGPDWHESKPLEAIFFVAYFLNGLLGAFAETACIILVSPDAVLTRTLRVTGDDPSIFVLLSLKYFFAAAIQIFACVFVILAWVGSTMGLLFGTLKATGLLRVSQEIEDAGLDDSKHGGAMSEVVSEVTIKATEA